MLQYLIGLSHGQIALLVIYLFIQAAFFSPFPEEVVLSTLGVLWSQGRIGFVEAFAAAFVGLACGDVILLTVGRILGAKLLVRRPFSWAIDPEMLAEATDRIRRHGPWLILLVRFTPMLRAPTYFASGISRMRPKVFLRSDLLGLVVWIPLLMLVGKRLGGSGSVEEAFHKIGILMLVLLVSGLSLTIYRGRKKRQQSIPIPD